MGYCCAKCFEDRYLQHLIAEQTEVGSCDYCHDANVRIMHTSKLGTVIRRGLDRWYQPRETAESSLDGGEEYATVKQVLQRERVFSERENCQPAQLLKDLLETESGKRPESTYQPETVIVERDLGWALKDVSWAGFCYSVKHYSRYPGTGPDVSRSFLDRMAQALDGFGAVLRQGQKVYRARLVTDDRPDESTLGPPPVRKSQNSRMSPAGVSYFYCSDSEQACIAEIRPAVGSEAYVAAFHALENRKILDLTRNPSMFDPGCYPRLWESKTFVDEFVRDASKPVLPEDSLLDYVPTQLFSEFIRRQCYDGIRYPASQAGLGSNYVFFRGPAPPHYPEDEDLEVDVLQPYTDWFRLVNHRRVRVDAVKYTFSSVT